jgi:mono/diheme cytochrome c family protein
MRRKLFLLSITIFCGFAFYLMSCNDSKIEKEESTGEAKSMSKEDMIKRGDYIVTTGSCGDCHSPKVMTQMGPVPDSTKLLSGSPGDRPLPPINAKSLQPGNWMSMAPDITAFVGPWGISYAANLTPDSATGIGAWNETTFINTIRSGKHLGNGRDILPPMPWPFISQMTDDDLKSVYAYLRSLPAVNNKVPAPVAPPDAAKMAEVK